MTLFDEVRQLSSESYDKWFERYFKKYDLEKVIKESAMQGYTGHLMSVLKVKDDYTRRRLDDERTLEKIKELLGDGFKVEYHLTYSKTILTGEYFITNKQIHISW
ncbi:TPA: hypothetical protein ACGPAL_000960 [Streptococcus suis]